MYIPPIPQNSLSEEIKKIIDFSLKLCNNYSFEYELPLSENEIKQIEDEFRLELPDSYKEWLAFTSSAEICGSLAHFYDIRKALKNPSLMFDDIIVIGDLIGDGEAICFSKTTKQLFTNNHGDVYNADSLSDILDEIIEYLQYK